MLLLLLLLLPAKVMAQIFNPEFCDYPPNSAPTYSCRRLAFTPNAQTSTYAIQWQLYDFNVNNQEATIDPTTQPFVGSNYFRYITSSPGNDVGLTARATIAPIGASSMSLSGITFATTLICVRFWYYVSANVNQLEIYLTDITAGTAPVIIWQVNSATAVVGTWTRQVVAASIAASTDSFVLEIQATSSGLQVADMGLARISVTFANAGTTCIDIIEEDIIVPASSLSTLASTWPALLIPILTDSQTQANTVQSNIWQSAFNFANLLPSLYQGFPSPCQYNVSFVTTAPTTFPYISIITEPRVSATIGAAMIGPLANAPTEIHVTPDVTSVTQLQHLAAHALGIRHQHRRADRPTYFFLNQAALDPIHLPYFAVDSTIDVTALPYDLASATQVQFNYLDQTGGASIYGTLVSLGNYSFGMAQSFSHFDLYQLTNLFVNGTGAVFQGVYQTGSCQYGRVWTCRAGCYNGGICARRPISATDNGVCLCKAGYSSSTNGCTGVSCFPPCQNGFCDPGNYCNCASSTAFWTGYRCHIPTSQVCQSPTCLNGGTCLTTLAASSTGLCLCPPGWTDPQCSTAVCEGSGCPGNTLCNGPNSCNCTSAAMGGQFCQLCSTGYIGTGPTGCSPVCSTDCWGQGTCIAPETCSCNTGFTGPACQYCIPGYEYLCYATTPVAIGCVPSCSSTGTCNTTTGQCICTTGYEGVSCDRTVIPSSSTTSVSTSTSSPATTTTQGLTTSTALARCIPQLLPLGQPDSTQFYARYVLSALEIDFQLVSRVWPLTRERQELEDFLNRALRREFNIDTDSRFARLNIVQVCPGILVDVLIQFFAPLNASLLAHVVLQQARRIGVPLSDPVGSFALSRLDFNYITISQTAAVAVQPCTVYVDTGACLNGGNCQPFLTSNPLISPSTVTLMPLGDNFNATQRPHCVCPDGWHGEFCQDIKYPLPIWAMVAIVGGTILAVILGMVAVYCLWDRRRRSQLRYLRAHQPFPPPQMSSFLMVPYPMATPQMSYPYQPYPQSYPQAYPQAYPQSLPPPPPYPGPPHSVATPTVANNNNNMATIPRSAIRVLEEATTSVTPQRPSFGSFEQPRQRQRLSSGVKASFS